MDWKNLLNNTRLRQSKRGKDARNDFESDFGRIIFSSAMRRMHDKTQVFPLTSDDNIHSRLTHSMEVMAIGHSFGIRICENEDFVKTVKIDTLELFRQIPVILKNACLVHDIGNPPFGHFGETVIQEYFKKYFALETENKHKATAENKEIKTLDLTIEQQEDFIHFDGNAQGFRLLTKLQILNDAFGLNLTYGTLATYTKYPNYGKIDENKIAKKKRGVFQSEVEYLKQISNACGLKNVDDIFRHPLCYLMEAADSICYLVMDIEDGFNKGWYSFTEFKNHFNSDPEIKDKISKLEEEHMGHGKEVSKMVNFRIYLIDRLVKLAVANFLKNLPNISKGEYDKELIKDDKKGLEKLLSDFCKTEIFPNREITSLELTGHSVLTGLLDYYINFVFHKNKQYRKRAQGLISHSVLKVAFVENNLPENSGIDQLSDYYKLRVIVDFISGMTDQFALNHYQKLSGQKIN